MVGGCYKIKLKAPSVDAKANTELVKWLAKQFGVAGCDVKIKIGITSRNKTVEIKYSSCRPDWFYE